MALSSFVLRDKIQQKIQETLSPLFLSVTDVTSKHVGHPGAVFGKGHFILHAVSKQFEGISRVDRNRMIFNILKEEMTFGIHSLSIRADTPLEWETEKKR